MKRKKRFTILRIALAMAVAAIVPATAFAKPTVDVGPVVGAPQAGPVEIPYLSHGVGVTAKDLGYANATTTSPAQRPEIPYLSHGTGITAAELGFATSNSPDDRSFARSGGAQAAPVVSGGGSAVDVNPFAVTGVGIALLLGAGMGLAIRQSRRTTPSTA